MSTRKGSDPPALRPSQRTPGTTAARAALMLAAALLTACTTASAPRSSAPAPTPSATAPAPTPSAEPDVVPAAAPPGPSPCRDEDLTAVATGGGAISNGFTGATIRLTNAGLSACVLPARPVSIGTVERELPTEPSAHDHGGPQTVPPGGVAAFNVSSIRIDGSGSCPRVAPRADSAPRQLAIDLDGSPATVVAGVIGGGRFTLACWPVQVSGLYLPAPDAAPGPDALWPADGDTPAAGACGSASGREAVIDVNPDTPLPRCVVVRPDQRIRVRNTSNRFSQPGRSVVVRLAGYRPRTIPVGGETLFDRPVGRYLVPGVHSLHLSLYPGSGGAEIWLRK